MNKTHGIKLSWLTEVLKKGLFRIFDCHTDCMVADIHTKYFPELAKWNKAKLLVGVVEDAAKRFGLPKYQREENVGARSSSVPLPEKGGKAPMKGQDPLNVSRAPAIVDDGKKSPKNKRGPEGNYSRLIALRIALSQPWLPV